MNKRSITTIIVTCLIIGIIIAGALTYKYFSSFQKVTFTIEQGVSVALYRRSDSGSDSTNDDTKISTLSHSQTVSLQPGGYYVIPEGNLYDQSQIGFTVADKPVSVAVDPAFSQVHLKTLLDGELSTIKSVLLAKYPQITTNFTLNVGTLYRDGSWYGTTLVQKAAPGNNGDVYRTVLHKVSGVWKIAAIPQLLITAPDNKTIPEDILKDLNSQTGYEN